MIVSDTDLSITEIVKGYKDLWKIERFFRTVKSFLEIRPIFHRKGERIEAHVFLCVLSLLMARIMEKSMNDEGEITLRSESENAREILNRMKIPYPGRIINSILAVADKN